MKDVTEEYIQRSREGAFSPYLASLVQMSGSAVRGVGATALLGDNTLLAGSVSGGCIESALVAEAQRCEWEQHARLMRFCAADDQVFGIPSPCGGDLSVLVYPADRGVLEAVHTFLQEGRGFYWGCCIDETSPSFGASFAGESSVDLVLSGNCGEQERSSLASLVDSYPAGESAFSASGWFVQAETAPLHLAIIGGAHISQDLAKLALLMGWKPYVIDPRAAFLLSSRYSPGVELIDSWPEPAFQKLLVDHRWAATMLSHDEKIDDQGVEAALKHGCFYTGALGSRRTAGSRCQRLEQRGLERSQLSRIHSPIGLSIGAGDPPGIAVSIVADIIQAGAKE